MEIDCKNRRVGRLTRIEQAATEVAKRMLSEAGFILSFGYGSKHPGIFAEKDGQTYFLPMSNSPSIEHHEANHMRQKCRKLLAGQWRPQA